MLLCRYSGSEAVLTIDDLIADWRKRQATLREQREYFKGGKKLYVAGKASEPATTEMLRRIEGWIAELDHLLAQYANDK